MKTLFVKGHVIKAYDSIDELPIINFQKYNKYLLIDSGLGSDVDDIDRHIVSLIKLIGTDSKKAQQELLNMRQTIIMINSEIAPRNLAFAALIHSIDGQRVTDLSDEGLQSVLNKLQRAKQSWLLEWLTKLKKKLEFEIETFFPEDAINPKEKESFDLIKKRTILILKGLAEPKKYQAEIEEIDKYLLGLYKPKAFNGSASAEVQYEKNFESSCLLIAQKTNLNPKNLTVLQFYNALERIKQQIEAESKAYKHHGRR